MGNITSTRWPKGYQKRRTVEECERITAREAWHVGAATVETPIGNTTARRLWCLCECGRRTAYLCRPPQSSQDSPGDQPGDAKKAGQWKCRRCHDLAYSRQQQRGTREAFARWLTPERWAKMSQKHPATERMYQAIGAAYEGLCAPYDWDTLNDEQRAELLTFYRDESAVRRAFDHQRDAYRNRIEEEAQAAGKEIRADLWVWWKQHNRSQPKPKNTIPTVQKIGINLVEDKGTISA
jgi:hypothetical protein